MTNGPRIIIAQYQSLQLVNSQKPSYASRSIPNLARIDEGSLGFPSLYDIITSILNVITILYSIALITPNVNPDMASTLPPLVQAVSGAIGSAAAGALTYPLEPVTTRLQLESNDRSKSKGLAGGVRVLHHIVRKYGIAALYDGLSVDIVAKLLSR